MKHYHYDPFSVLGGRENCTVGALRKHVEGHDVSIRSQRREGRQKVAVKAADLQRMATAGARD